MILFCPRCGAELASQIRGEWLDTSRKCLDCGVEAAEPPGMLAPSDDELTYGLDEWPVADRAVVTEALTVDGIPYRWEPGIVLVVPEAVEAVVDGLLDELEGSDGDGDAPAGDTDGLDLDGLGADGGEEAQAAMSDLYVAADRLQHAPGDVELVVELLAIADVVGAVLPPYGIEESVWRRIHEMAVAVGEAADEDGIAETSSALRNFLRPYV